MPYSHRFIPTLDKGIVVVLYRMRIEQLAGIVGVVAGSLHPDGKIIIIMSLPNKLGVATCEK
jgi:hypothetical protein